MGFMNNKVYHIDNIEGMAQLHEKCANLIISDPPYYRVKGDFDFDFADFEDYKIMMRKQAKAYKRILADNGTLFVYGSAKNIAYVQVIFDEYFNLENNITIEFNRQTKKGVYEFRCFAPVTERLLMYSNEINRTGLEEIKLDVNNFKPLRQYFKELQGFIGLNLKRINETLGHRKAEHCFYHSSTQWDMPTVEIYNELIKVYKINEWSGFREYEGLRQEYEGLRQEYEGSRRPFNNFMGLFDVMNFNQEAHITTNYDHDTVKPETLTRALILTCSRVDDLVVVPFSGSGTECAMAKKEKRNYVGFDNVLKYVKMSNKRCEAIQPELF